MFEGSVPDFGVENLNLGVVSNRLTDVDSSMCDRDWNDGATAKFGCDGIACPVGTAKWEGLQSTEDNSCTN